MFVWLCIGSFFCVFFFFSSRRRHTRCYRDWSSDVCSSDLYEQIKFEPYWGAMKGAVGTLWTKAGGPTDQASLTIALLRASNIPSRYVRGTIYSQDDRIRRWLGVKTDVAAMWTLGMGIYPTRQALDPIGVGMSHV